MVDQESIRMSKENSRRKYELRQEQFEKERQEEIDSYKKHTDFMKNILRFYHFRLLGSKLEIMPKGGVTLAIVRYLYGYAIIPTRCSLKDNFCHLTAKCTAAVRYDEFTLNGFNKTFPITIVRRVPSYKDLQRLAWEILYDYFPSDQEYLDTIDPALVTVDEWRKELSEKSLQSG